MSFNRCIVQPIYRSTAISFNRCGDRYPFNRHHTAYIPVDRHVIQPIHQLTDISFNRCQSTAMSFNRYTSRPTGQVEWCRLNGMSVDWYIGCIVRRLNDMAVGWHIGCTVCRLNDMSVYCCRSNGYWWPQCSGPFNRTICSPVLEEQ